MGKGKKEKSGGEESSACGNTTKGTAKGVAKSRRGRGGVYGQAARSAARRRSMEEKSGACLTMKGIGCHILEI